MQERQKIHVRKRGYLCVPPQLRLGAQRVRGKLLDWIFDGIAYYPGRQLVVVLVDFAVELHEYGIRRVLDAEDEIYDAAEQDGEPEFVRVPAGV
jgi:hypothetical protein